MKYFEQCGNAVLFRENGELLKIEPWGKNSFRVRSTFLGAISDSEVNALLPCETMDTEICIEDMTASIKNGKIEAHMKVEGWGNHLRITYKNSEGKTLLSEIPNGGALQKKARHFMPLQGNGYKLKASFVPEAGEKLYGMGQYQQELFDLKGCNLELAHRNSQASIPFYISSVGYGFLWNNPAIGEVHFGVNTTEWVANVTKQLDYWITAGDSPAEIEKAYAHATGLTPMMPEYGMGFWQCKLRYYNEEQVLDIARGYKERGITPDILVIDYYHWPRCGDYRFDEEYFPHPDEMIAKLKEMGINTMVSVWPQIDWRSENYQEMKQKGLLVKSNAGVDVQMIFHGNNVFMDATNPDTRKYVWNRIKKNYFDKGVKAFWLDEAEPEFGTYDYDQYRFYDGPVMEVGNEYPREYSRMFYEGQKEAGQDDIINLVRCAWAGSQRYGALVWSGDIFSNYTDFRRQICAGIQMGLAGIPWWNSDIGGFHGGDIRTDEFKELLVRWFQFGAFCPVMRIHGCRAPQETIINKAGEEREWTGAPNEIWSFGPKIEKILTKYIRIREAMRDYIRDVMKEAHEEGSPVMRAMFYEFPEDKETYDICDQYMFGPDVLVAPVCYEGATERKVYLPKGAKFTLAHTGEVFEGGQYVTIQAPLDIIPLFLRDNKQIFLVDLMQKETL